MPPPVIALLGPTNTGKTHHAMERMLEHRTGMIGFPLRLLARENYDRVVRLRGEAAVALVTGEERILPPAPSYFVCTVEAMPLERRVDFLAVDEVQLAADRERGHVFTDRILHARGREETLLLGAETVRPLLRALLPEAGFITRPRLSVLSYAAPRKIARLPRRSAVVAFSIAEVYALAERVRQQVGGAAVVFGALSPRTRNAQVGLYQAGEVDHLVATDAIGMGLNLDIEHVAFTSLVKFDGVGPRPLRPAEVAQVAGRAGRHVKDGSFGATADLGEMDPRLVEAVVSHRFEPLPSVFWRNDELDFHSPAALLASLERRPPRPELVRMRRADDHAALEALAGDPEVQGLARDPEGVRLLWEVCQVPDFRNVMTEAHTRLLAQLFRHLSHSPHRLPEDWVAAQVEALDRTDGDVDTLLARIAGIRTWTYVSHRSGWLSDPRHWQARARAVEDRLSDTLHERLTEQFVDRRAAVVARVESEGGELLAEVGEAGEVLIQGLQAGRLLGFRFQPDPGVKERSRALMAAANRALRETIGERVRLLAEAPDAELSLSPSAEVLWRGAPVARLLPGESALLPRVEIVGSDLLDVPLRDRVRRRAADWLTSHVAAVLGPLLRLREARLSGAGRGLGFVLAEGLGAVPCRVVSAQLRDLTPEDRPALARLGVALGRHWVFSKAVLGPEALRLRALLWCVREGREPLLAPGGRPWVALDAALPEAFLGACSYQPLGPLALRVDRLERLAAAARQAGRKGPFLPTPAMAAAASVDPTRLGALLEALGFLRDAEGRHHPPRPSRGQGRGRRPVRS